MTICNIYFLYLFFCLWWRNTCSSFFYLFVTHLLSYIPFYRGTGLSSGVYGFFSHLLYDVAYTFSFLSPRYILNEKYFWVLLSRKWMVYVNKYRYDIKSYVEYNWVYYTYCVKQHYIILRVVLTVCTSSKNYVPRHLDSILLQTLILFQ